MFVADNFGTQVYEAVLTATKRSLLTLAEASGCEIHSDSHKGEGDGLGSVHSLDLAEKPERPLSSLSVLSDMPWTSAMDEEITFLQ